jgi:8-oxo-dGTP pyrophosphatase MutT (NUDIX family)
MQKIGQGGERPTGAKFKFTECADGGSWRAISAKQSIRGFMQGKYGAGRIDLCYDPKSEICTMANGNLLDTAEFSGAELFNNIIFEHSDYCPLEKYSEFIPEDFDGVFLASVNVLADNSGKILLTQRKAHMRAYPKAWVFPGGHVDPGDSFVQAARRELSEEVGVSVRANGELAKGEYRGELKPFFCYEAATPIVLDKETPLRKHFMIIFYYVKLDESWENIPVVIQESEVERYEWVNLEDLFGLVGGCGNELDTSHRLYEQLTPNWPNAIGEGIAEGHAKAIRALKDFLN